MQGMISLFMDFKELPFMALKPEALHNENGELRSKITAVNTNAEHDLDTSFGSLR